MNNIINEMITEKSAIGIFTQLSFSNKINGNVGPDDDEEIVNEQDQNDIVNGEEGEDKVN